MGVTCSISFHGAWHRHISYGGCFSRDAPVPRAAAYHGLRATEHRANGWGYYMHPPVWCPFHSTQGWCPRDNARYIESYCGTHAVDQGASHQRVRGQLQRFHDRTARFKGCKYPCELGLAFCGPKVVQRVGIARHQLTCTQSEKYRIRTSSFNYVTRSRPR